MTTVARTPGSLTIGPLRPVILRLALPAVAMMACHFSFNLIDSIWVGRLIGAAALAAVSTAGFYVWVLLSLGEMVEVGLIAVAARRHGEGRPDTAARAAGAAVLYALAAGTAVSLLGLSLTDDLFRLMAVPAEVARLGHAYLPTWLLGGPLVFGFFAVDAVHVAVRHSRAGGTGCGAQGRRDRLHGHLGVRPVGERARGTESGRPPGGPGPPGGPHDGRLLPAGHDRDRRRVPHGAPGVGGTVHAGPCSHHRRESLPPCHRAGAAGADVRDHSRGRPRGSRVHVLAADREHRADAVAPAAGGVVVGHDRVARDLVGPLSDGDCARYRHDVVLDIGRLAAGCRMMRLTADG